jgi:hypothetical protein
MSDRWRDAAVLIGGMLVLLAVIRFSIRPDRQADRRCMHQIDWIIGGCRA